MDWDEDSDLDLIVDEEPGYVNLFRNSTVGVENRGFDLVNKPREYALLQNYPNPFNLETTIEYQLPHSCFVELKIFNLLGQEMKNLAEQETKAGYFKIVWNGTDESGNYVNSRIYVVTLYAGDFVQTRKLILLK